MPYIIKNGKTYTGNSVTLTQAQYDALSEVEKNNGTVYYIYDSDTVLDASDVALDNGTVEDLAGSVATIETSPATAIHAVGDFILWNGQLYTVTSAIAVGETLTVGSNITATSAGSEITELKSGLTFTPTLRSGFSLASWGYVTGFRMGSLCYVACSGIKSTNALSADTPAIDIPYRVKASAMCRFPVGTTGTKFGIVGAGNGQQYLTLNEMPANENAFFTLVFAVND